MKPLQELLKGKVVNCQTEEEAKEFLSFMHENGYKWRSEGSLLSRTYFERNRDDTCYFCYVETKYLEFGNKERAQKEEFKLITYQQFKQLINENNMETKEVKIQVPEGYEIDKENSTFDCIKFKPIKKVVSYEDVIHKLNDDAIGVYTSLPRTFITSLKQSEKLLAINKLMNVAKYLNGEWRPDWEKEYDTEIKYFITKTSSDELTICHIQWTNDINIFFKSYNLAKQAIEILGEETIKLALSTDW